MAVGPADVRTFERCIQEGGVVIFPSDGVYGLACDPLNAGAIDRIYALKGRDEGKPAAVMYFSVLAMRELLTDLDDSTRRAVGALLPGPLTLVVSNAGRRYPLACRSAPDKLGVRLIEGPLQGASVAVFQTSANRSGEPASASLEGVPDEIREGADLVLDDGELSGVASTVVDLTEWPTKGRWEILREGPARREDVARALGRC